MKHNPWLNRLWAWILIGCILISGIPVAVSAEETEAEAPVIPEDAIYLSTAADILSLAENCVSDVWSRDKVVVLQNDISLNGIAFMGIPTFGGTFLGQGHTISGYRLTHQQSALGFFRYLQKSALVQDLHLKGTVQPAKSGNLDIGGFVGVNSGTVRGCTFDGTVSGTERVGGIAGRNTVSGILEDISVSGTIYGDHYIGGIAGDNLGVIRSCSNGAEINAYVSQNSVSMGITSGFSLESLTAKESTSDATNIGGIAGTSSGVIRGCENHAPIGYEKMGYNVGGIAGSQIGYITECTNYGTVNGSNGVGGIVGQFKPNVVLNFGENLMSKLMDQTTSLMGSMSGMMSSMSGMMNGMSTDMESLEDAMEALKNPENLDPDSLSAALNEFSNSFNNMYNDMSAMGSGMTSQMSSMMGSMNAMVDTMEKLNEGMDIKILDISKEDDPENTLTKISNCANQGAVLGETYVGGIAGIADIEDTTAKDEIEGMANFANEGEIIMRLVIRDCRNLGTVSATKEYAGGIVGNMTIGAIFHGMNIGSIDALNASYVGGIAGRSDTYIVDSYSRSILAGGTYVGCIAGYGTEVIGCYAITDIAAATQFAGGILGDTDPLPDEGNGLILNNRYYLTGKNLGGIDGISYENATAPMTLEEFLAAETLDDLFRTVSIRFIAKGQEDIVLSVELGQTLPVAKIPQLEVGEHQQYQWQLIPDVTAETLAMGETAQVQYVSRERLTSILFDQTYEAVFDAKNTVVATEEHAASGRSLALAVGAFDQGTTLTLTEAEPTVNDTAVLEAWKVTMADIGIEKLHYHIPENVSTENLTLYVKDISGNWVQRDFTVEGSYIIFPFTHGETSFALEVLPADSVPMTAVAIAAAALLLVLIGAIRRKKRKAAKKESANESA